VPSDLPGNGGIPPLKDLSEYESSRKSTRDNIAVSQRRSSDSPQASKKKTRLIKQEISIAPDRNRETPKKNSSGSAKTKTGKVQTTSQKASAKKKLHDSPANELPATKPDDNWVEAEIPGLIMDPQPVPAETESIPTFKASPKPEEPLQEAKTFKEKQSSKVKNPAPHSEEKKDSKSQKPMKIEADLPDMKTEIPGSEPKQVEFEAPVVSHEKVTDKGNIQKTAKSSSAKAGLPGKNEAKAAEVDLQKPLKASPDKTRPKPFFLDLKFLDREEKETVTSVSQDNLPADPLDGVIERLNALQDELERQWVSTPSPLTEKAPLTSANQEKRQPSQIERSTNEPTGSTQVSLDELDSFLFTARQRKQ